MTDGCLFSLPEPSPKEAEALPKGAPRIRRADRRQMRLVPTSLDSLLDEGHQARAVWGYVAQLDLSALYESIEAVKGKAGRPATDPKILLALWLYATIDGVGSARALDRLCREHVAYRWICGGVGMNFSTLSEFRRANVTVLNELLTQSVAVLRCQGLVTLKRLAQDGMRVRASAGAGSFRRAKSLKQALKYARRRIRKLQRELDEDPAACTKRQRAAKEHAAKSRAKRIEEALKQVKNLAAKKPEADKDKARASTTDPEARVMKMPDGGFRPAYNVQIAADTESQVIVGVDVTNKGSDLGEMSPMVEQVFERHGTPPEEVLVDGGFAKQKDIERVAGAGCTVYAPVPKPRYEDTDRYEPRPKDSEEIAEWRQRMRTDEAKEIYKERAATVECVNALARNRGLRQFPVRGLKAVKSVALLFALAHNLMRTLALVA